MEKPKFHISKRKNERVINSQISLAMKQGFLMAARTTFCSITLKFMCRIKTSLMTLHYGHFMDPKYESPPSPSAHSCTHLGKKSRPSAMNEIAGTFCHKFRPEQCMAMVFWCETDGDAATHYAVMCVRVRSLFARASRGSVRPVRPSAASLVFIRRRPSPPKIYRAHTSSL